MLDEVLEIERVSLPLDASDKASALRALARLFEDRDSGIEADEVERVFVEREALASTGIGSGVAIPHGRIQGLAGVRAALALHPSGVDFDAVDGEPVHIIVAVLAPESQPSLHLKTLAEISRRLRLEGVRQALMACSSAVEARAVLVG